MYYTILKTGKSKSNPAQSRNVSTYEEMVSEITKSFEKRIETKAKDSNGEIVARVYKDPKSQKWNFFIEPK